MDTSLAGRQDDPHTKYDMPVYPTLLPRAMALSDELLDCRGVLQKHGCVSIAEDY